MSGDKSLRFYLLAVCFVAMVCAAITTGMVLYGLVKIAAPELTLDAWSYSAHQSLDNFQRSQFNPAHLPAARLLPPGRAQAIAINPEGRVSKPAQQSERRPLSLEELERARQESFRQILSNHRREAMQNLIRLSIVLLVSSALFYTHWRMARRHSSAASHSD